MNNVVEIDILFQIFIIEVEKDEVQVFVIV